MRLMERFGDEVGHCRTGNRRLGGLSLLQRRWCRRCEAGSQDHLGRAAMPAHPTLTLAEVEARALLELVYHNV